MHRGGLIASLIAFAFFANAIGPQFEAIVLSHMPGRSERYARLRVWGSIGFIAIALLYGLLLDHLDARWLPALMLPWMALVCLLSFSLDYGPGHHHAPAVSMQDVRAALRRREVWGFFVLMLLMQMAFSPYHMLYSLYLREHGYSSGAIGGLWAVGVGIEIATFFAIAPILLRYAPRTLMLAGLAAGTLRWLAMALLPGIGWVMVLAQLLHALSFAAFYAAAMRLLARYFPGRLMGYG
ncbi:mfs metabolite transporter, partial [mine drainage metagenome]